MKRGEQRPEAFVEDAAFRGPLAKAIRLCAPGAVSGLVVGLLATSGAGSASLAVAVACGVIAGAAMSALFPVSIHAAPSDTSSDDEEHAEEAPAPVDPLSESLGGGVDVLSRLPLPIVLVDADGLVAFANAAADAEIGAAISGMHYSAALRTPAMVRAVTDAIKNDASTTFAFSLRRSQERHLSAIVAPIHSEDGMLKAMILLEDQTRMRRAEQLHRDFVANASHELKTPLASITGFIETLQDSARSDPEARERFLGIMAQQAERMRRLVEDLLSLNRIELQEHVAPEGEALLGAVIAEAISTAAPAAEASGTIQTTPFDETMVLRGDHGELVQLFVNLIVNAYKYGGDKRAPRLSLLQSDDRPGHLGVCVEDFGPGVDKQHIPRLTERFYRVDAPTSRRKNGTGLGLAIVKHVIARHRGDLEIDSELGRGSRFVAWLPQADDRLFDDATAPPSSETPSSAATGPSATATKNVIGAAIRALDGANQS